MSTDSYLQLHTALYEWSKECPRDLKTALDSYFLTPEFLDRPNTFYIAFDEDALKWMALITMKGLDETRAAINRRFNYDFMQLHASTNTFSKIEPAPRMAKGNAYTKFTKAIQKLNKKVKSLQRLVGYQQSLKHAVDLVCKRDHADLSPLRFISVDIESYEQDHSLILEIGWSTWDTALNKFADRHFAVHNYKHLANGRYVADRRDRFLFGDTVWANLSDCIAAFQEDLNTAAKENDEGSVVLIAHDMSSDETYLRRMGVEFPQGMIKFDTVELNSARINDSNTKTGLGKLLDEVGIENYSLHNAGNDAHYTLELFLFLCRNQDKTTNA